MKESGKPKGVLYRGLVRVKGSDEFRVNGSSKLETRALCAVLLVGKYYRSDMTSV